QAGLGPRGDDALLGGDVVARRPQERRPVTRTLLARHRREGDRLRGYGLNRWRGCRGGRGRHAAGEQDGEGKEGRLHRGTTTLTVTGEPRGPGSGGRTQPPNPLPSQGRGLGGWVIAAPIPERVTDSAWDRKVRLTGGPLTGHIRGVSCTHLAPLLRHTCLV